MRLTVRGSSPSVGCADISPLRGETKPRPAVCHARILASLALSGFSTMPLGRLPAVVRFSLLVGEMAGRPEGVFHLTGRTA